MGIDIEKVDRERSVAQTAKILRRRKRRNQLAKDRKLRLRKESNEGVKWFRTIFYPQEKTGRAARFEDGILPRLREKEITFFTPIGPPYWFRRESTDAAWAAPMILSNEPHLRKNKEIATLEFLKNLLESFKQNMPDKTFRWLFIGADLYGTRINRLSPDIVESYFRLIQQWLKKNMPESRFQLWSEYNELAEVLRADIRPNLERHVGEKTLAAARRTASKLSQAGDPVNYLVERVTEAHIIEQFYHPIKVSCVRRKKDDMVDGNLPRLYFVPEDLHAPWLR